MTAGGEEGGELGADEPGGAGDRDRAPRGAVPTGVEGEVVPQLTCPEGEQLAHGALDQGLEGGEAAGQFDLEPIRHRRAGLGRFHGVLVVPGAPGPADLPVDEAQLLSPVAGPGVLGVAEQPTGAQRVGEHGRTEPDGDEPTGPGPAVVRVLGAAEAGRGEPDEGTGALHPLPDALRRGVELVSGLDPHGVCLPLSTHPEHTSPL